MAASFLRMILSGAARGGKAAWRGIKEYGPDVAITLMSGLGGAGSLFGSAVSAGMSSAEGGGTYRKTNVNIGVEELPHMDEPDVVVNETNPNISTIIGQLNSIIRLASRIGAITQEQQDVLLEQVRAKRAVGREQDLEASDMATLEGGDGGCCLDSLEPVSDSFEALAKTVKSLTSVINQIIESGGLGGGGGAPVPVTAGRAGAAGGAARGVGRAARATAAERRALERAGMTVGPRGGVTRNGRRVATSEIDDVLAAHAARVERNTNLLVTGASIAPGLAMTLGGTIAAYNQDHNRNKLSNELVDAVRSVTGRPIQDLVDDRMSDIVIRQGMDKDIAVDNILNGNPAASGINETQSNLLNTVIPGLKSGMVPQAYRAVFQTDAATDPMAGERMPLIMAALERVIGDSLRRKIKQGTVVTQQPRATSSAPPPPPPPPGEPSAPSAPPTGTPPGPDGSPAGSLSSPTASSAPGETPAAIGPTTPNASPTEPPAASGVDLNAASIQAENALMSPDFYDVPLDNTGTIEPQRGPFTLPDNMSAGIGTVHCPLFLSTPDWIIETTE